MMESHKKKRKLSIKHGDISIKLTAIKKFNDEESNDRRLTKGNDVHVQTELTAIMLDDEETNFRRYVVSKDVGVQVELAVIMLDGNETNFQQHVVSEDVEIKSNSPQKFDKPHLNLNKEEIFDQSHVPVVMEASENAPNDSITKISRVVESTTELTNLTTTNIVNDIKADIDPIVGYVVALTTEETDLTTRNSINYIRADFDPIVGYAEEPLLPLFEACAPLTNILHNLSFYVQMALNETLEQPPDGLTVDESAAIRLYTIEWDSPHRSLYSMLNHTLKYDDRENLRPYFKYLKLFVTALVKLPCVPQLTVWRGVTKNLSADFPPGTRVTWWAFSSCTTQLTVLENNMYLGNTGNRTLFSVEAINGRTIRAHSHFVTEDEILLLPGTHMIVQSQLSPAPDLHIIHLKQVKPEQMLLQPPFEGNLNIFNNLF